MSASDAVPAPFSVAPTWQYDGDDGLWSTFEINLGTPPQTFRVLPSTTTSETWVPIPEGCEGILQNIADCGTLRGVNYYQGESSRGFQTDASNTWELIGIYNLATEQNIWGTEGNQGFYGQDTISLGRYPSGQSVDFLSQIVAGVSTANVWVGSLGMGTSTAGFKVKADGIPSLLSTMKNQSIIPSLSFGYTVGSSYSSPQTPGSLILGGYDQARFKPSDISFPLGGDDEETLPVNVQSIVAEDVFGGTLSLLPGGSSITTIIDSTTSQMWLPQNVCDLFATAFGLRYDSYTGLYIVNNTIHNELLDMNPTVTFTLSSTDDAGSNTNIEFPYAAFDLQAGIPLFNLTTNYFPLRVAQNESQQVLGRAFLQEAYVFVDWERRNFTISQAIHQNSTTDIQPVLSPVRSTSEDSSSLSTGAIVGIAVGAVAIIASIIGLLIFFKIRSRRRRTAAHKLDEPTELSDDPMPPPEIMSKQYHELSDAENSKVELGANQLTELHGDAWKNELEGSATLDKYGKEKREYYELP